MPDSSLLPEQEDLLCRLVEAHNRLLPDREPFHYVKDMTGPADVAILMHSGWPQDSAPVFLDDLDALAEGGYIRRRPLGRGWKFNLRAGAFEHYESRQHPVAEDSKTKAALKPESGEPTLPLPMPLPIEDQPGGGLAKRATGPARVEEPCLPIYCRAITREGVRTLTKVEYDELVKHRSEYDMFIDGSIGEALCRQDKSKPRPAKLTLKAQSILSDFIESRKPMRPRSTRTGSTCLSRDSACRLFERARAKVDVKLGRREHRAFRLHRNAFDPKLKAFEFAPPNDLQYCVIVLA
jgi:hypothetical protein